MLCIAYSRKGLLIPQLMKKSYIPKKFFLNSMAAAITSKGLEIEAAALSGTLERVSSAPKYLKRLFAPREKPIP